MSLDIPWRELSRVPALIDEQGAEYLIIDGFKVLLPPEHLRHRARLTRSGYIRSFKEVTGGKPPRFYFVWKWWQILLVIGPLWIPAYVVLWVWAEAVWR